MYSFKFAVLEDKLLYVWTMEIISVNVLKLTKDCHSQSYSNFLEGVLPWLSRMALGVIGLAGKLECVCAERRGYKWRGVLDHVL